MTAHRMWLGFVEFAGITHSIPLETADGIGNPLEYAHSTCPRPWSITAVQTSGRRRCHWRRAACWDNAIFDPESYVVRNFPFMPFGKIPPRDTPGPGVR